MEGAYRRAETAIGVANAQLPPRASAGHVSSVHLSAAAADAVFWVAALACAFAQVGITWSMFGRQAANHSPDSDAPGGAAPSGPAPTARIGRVAEIAWALLPAIALGVLLAVTWQAMHRARLA